MLRAGMKNLRTLLIITALVGWLPVLIVYLAMRWAVATDPGDPPEGLVFVLLYLALVACGAFAFHRWFD